MTKQKTHAVEDGVIKVLEVLLAEQSKYKSPLSRHFTSGCIHVHALERGYFKGQFGKDEVESNMERADQIGYLERGALHARMGNRDGMLVGYRIKDDQLEEVKRLVGK